MQKIIFILLFCFGRLLMAQSGASNKPTINLPNYDDKTLHYGFVLALNYATFTLKPSSTFYQLNDTLRRVNPIGVGGFTLGFILNARLQDHFDFRVTPQVGFYQRGVEYSFYNKKTGSIDKDLQTVEATFVELPLLVKFKSQRRNNFRMYVIGGVKPSLSTSNKNKDQRPDKLRFNSYDFAIDYGLGCDIYFPLFKLSPEIRFSNGLANMKAKDNNLYANTIQNLRTNTITLMLNFE
jgi:hypothetical protein